MLKLILEQQLSLFPCKYTKYLEESKSISLWAKEYEAGEFWKERREKTADPQPPCTKIGSSLLARAAEPTHFEPSWDPISQFATQGKGSIQDRFTRKTTRVISLLPLSSLPLEPAAAVPFVSPHVSLRMHFPIVITGATDCRGGFTDPLWFVQSLQFAEFSAGRWAGLLHITRCFTSVKVQASNKFLVCKVMHPLQASGHLGPDFVK